MKIERFKYFYPEHTRLAHIDRITHYDHEGNVAELKRNGSRLQLHHLPSSGRMRWQAWNRHEEIMSYKPNVDVARALKSIGDRLDGYCLFDGELRHGKVKGIQHMMDIYDVFIWQGKLLIGKPFWYRRGLLEKLFNNIEHPIGIATQYHTDFKYIYDVNIIRPEIEGLVVKSLMGKLDLGRNRGMDSKWMWKFRRPSNSYRF